MKYNINNMVGVNKISLHAGFTIIELSIVIAVIGIMAAISFAYIPSSLKNGRDNERIADAKGIASYLEQRYRERASATYPTYPSTSSFTSDVSGLSSGGLKETLNAPGQSSSSVVIASSIGDLTLNATIQTYIYQPFSSNGSLCTSSSSSSPCTRFKIWYKLEATSQVRVVESRYQQ